MSKYYITTPIYYVNASPHIGHAYTSIIADSMTRYKKAQGLDVFYLTGTDEHGQKVKEAAKKCNKETLEFVDEVSGNFKNLWKLLNIDYDLFIRTTQPDHKEVVKEFILKLEKNGDISLKTKKNT